MIRDQDLPVSGPTYFMWKSVTTPWHTS